MTRRSVGPQDWVVEDRGHETPCWIWTATVAFARQSDHRRVGISGRRELAHVAVYKQEVGEVPAGNHLHHRCSQPACVRPDHLQPLPASRHQSLHHRRLTDEQVIAIRSDRRLLREVAADYGTSTTHVSDIRRGKTRKALYGA